MVRLLLSASILYAASVLGLGFTGKFVGVPEDAIEAQQTMVESPILNGGNYQSRIDVKLALLTKTNNLKVTEIPVKKSYQFDVSGLHNGEYQLLINSYDFNLRNNRYRVVVNDEVISVYEESLGSKSYNQSSLQVVGPQQPLIVDVVDYKEYYKSPQGKLTEMVMNSPFGFIFRNSLYTALFVACIVIMAAPYIISLISPELAEEMNEIQRGETKHLSQKAEVPTSPNLEAQNIKASGRAKSGGARQRK